MDRVWTHRFYMTSEKKGRGSSALTIHEQLLLLSSEAFAAVSWHFWDVMMCQWVTGSQHFKPMYWSYLRGLKHQLTSLPDLHSYLIKQKKNQLLQSKCLRQGNIQTETTDDLTAVVGIDKILHIPASMQIPQTDGNATKPTITKTYEVSW